jgi:hypothetical protein
MDLATYFATVTPVLLGKCDGAALSSSKHRGLYPRIVRTTWRDTLRALAPLTMKALEREHPHETDALVDAYLDEHPPAPRALERITEQLGAFLVDTRGMHAAWRELVDVDDTERAVASHPATREMARPGVNPTLLVRHNRYPVVRYVRELRSDGLARLPVDEAPETTAYVRHPMNHRVTTTVLTPKRLFALAKENGEALPPLDANARAAIAVGRRELVLRHVILEGMS